MTIQPLQLRPSLEQPEGKCGSGAVGSRPRPYGLAQTLALLLAGLLLLGCEADGVPGNPLGIKLQWFSFLDGDDFKRQCDAGEPDRYRLIYNARFEEQVRVYDVTEYGKEAILRARAVAPGFVLTATRDSLDFGWQESQARLTPEEFAEFKRRLQQSGFFAPGRARALLPRFLLGGHVLRGRRLPLHRLRPALARIRSSHLPGVPVRP